MFNARSLLFALLSGTAFCSASLAPAIARAQSAPEAARRAAPAPFGAKGSIVFDKLMQYDSLSSSYGMFGISIQHTEETGAVAGTNDRRTISFAPAADWFPIRNLSLGLAASIQHFRSEIDQPQYATPKRTSEVTSASIQPRIGYVLPLTRELSLWPRASIGFRGPLHSEADPGAFIGPLHTVWTGSIGLPLVVTPSRNLFFAIGPELRASFSGYDGVVGSDGVARSQDNKYVELGMVGGLGLVFGR